MAELFSLMPDFTSCKNGFVEANRSLLPRHFANGVRFRDGRSHQSNHQDTKTQSAQRNDPFLRAARGNGSSSCLGVLVFLGAFVFSLFYGAGRSKIEVPKRRMKRTHLAKNASIFKEFIF
jgi:hypothetical protein